jgi:hypothetical protein
MASERLHKVNTQRLKILDSITMVANKAIPLLATTMMRVTKNAADLDQEAVDLQDLQEATTGGLLAQAKEAPVVSTTGMLTLRLSPRFTSLL